MRPLALVLFLAASAVTVGCGPTMKCGPGNCSGCCDASGACQLGSANSACGTGGLICNACFVGQTCSLGICNSAGSGGGNGNGGGFGGGFGGGSGGGSGGGFGGGGTGGGFGGGTGGGFGGGGTGGGTGGGFGGGTGGGSPSSYETWCRNTWLPALCDAAVRCGIYASTSTCQALSTLYSVCATTPGLRDGRTVLDSSAASSCVSQFNGSACDYDYSSCALAQRGTGTLNSPCYVSTDCQPELYCSTLSCPGVCQPRAPIGSSSAGAECVPGAYSYEGICQGFVPLGQSCAPVSPSTADRQCGPTGFCTSSKICAARKVAGQSCTSSYGECGVLLTCSGGVCGPAGNLGSPCDSTRACKVGYKCGNTNTCVAIGAVGAPCTSQFSDCQPDLICDIPMGQTQGTCARTATLGEPCSFSGYQCGFIGSLYCTATSVNPSGICAMKKGTGASCTSSAECSTSVCATGVCGGCADPTP